MQGFIRPNTFNGSDVAFVSVNRERKARADWLAIQKNGTGSTDADAAAFLGSGQPKIFPQEIDQ
jgi:hypothetical protein